MALDPKKVPLSAVETHLIHVIFYFGPFDLCEVVYYECIYIEREFLTFPHLYTQ